MSLPALPRVAVVQMTSTPDLDANFESARSLVEQAVAGGAVMVFFPESFACIAPRPSADSGELPFSASLDGELFARYLALAKTHSVWLSLGGFQEQTEDGQRRYNTHVIVNAAGQIVQTYRKLHLFDVGVQNGPSILESSTTAPGDALAVAACDALGDKAVLGLSVCYDLRFAPLYSSLRRAGANVMLVPSAFFLKTGLAHWEVLLRARSIETQSYVIAAAQTGVHHVGRESYGDACIIDPWGTVVARVPLGVVGVAFADLDLSRVDKIRTSMPVFEHRREEVYRSRDDDSAPDALSAHPAHCAPAECADSSS